LFPLDHRLIFLDAFVWMNMELGALKTHTTHRDHHRDMSFVEDKLVAFEKYGKSSCLPQLLKTMQELAGPDDESKHDWMFSDSWKVVIRVEKWLDKQEQTVQTRFGKASRLVLENAVKEVVESPELRGLSDSLHATRLFVQHILSTLGKSQS
jgi:hypothetical protein